MQELPINPEAREILDGIVAKSIEELSENDVAFLKARRMYLTSEQAEKFDSVLNDKEEINLLDLKRSELDEMAVKLGLNPEDYKNKVEVATAISETQSKE